jgi:hypothetical protein
MAGARRDYLYPVALAGLLAFLGGMAVMVWQLSRRAVALPAGMVDALISPAVIPWLLLSLLGLLVWVAVWDAANRAARPLTLAGAAERSSVSRKMFLYVGQLAALATAAGLMFWALRSAVLRLFALVGLGAYAPGWPIFQVAGAAIALLTWGYLRWQTLSDGDIGREHGSGVRWRRMYSYGVALAGLLLGIGGGGELVRSLIQFARQPLVADAPWRVPFATALAALIVGVLLSGIGWRWSTRAVQVQPTGELNALSRVLLRHAGLLLSALITLVSLGYLIDQAILRGLGLPAGQWWSYALAYLPAGMVAWLSYSSGIRDDRAEGGETARTATIRRVVRYGLSAAGLAVFWIGLTEVARLVLQVMLATQTAGPAFDGRWWGRFALATALVLVGAPAWWGHWWPLQVRARARGQSGHSERASRIRHAYLYLIVLAGAAVVVFALGFGAFLALNWRAAGNLGGVSAAVAGAGAAALVALVWAVAHALIVRGDDQLLAADRAAQIAAQAKPPAVAAPVAAATPGDGGAPRQYSRAELATLAAGAGIAVMPGQSDAATGPQSIAVIDGSDGAAGAALIAALRSARPDLAIWPMGLNAAAHIAMIAPLDAEMPPPVPADILSAVNVIIGPADILSPGALDGEVSDELFAAVAHSPARVLLLPPRDGRFRWVGAPDWPLAQWVENAVIDVGAALQEHETQDRGV